MQYQPYGYRPSLLAKAFTRFGEVQDVERLYYTDTTGWGKVMTGTMIVSLLCTEEQRLSIPHLAEIDGKRLLLTMADRPPLCLWCNGVGHVRARCIVAMCSLCGQLGHSASDCDYARSRRSYADHARPKQRPTNSDREVPATKSNETRSITIEDLQGEMTQEAANAARLIALSKCSDDASDAMQTEIDTQTTASTNDGSFGADASPTTMISSFDSSPGSPLV